MTESKPKELTGWRKELDNLVAKEIYNGELNVSHIAKFMETLLAEVIDEIPDDEILTEKIHENGAIERLVNTHVASKFKQQLKDKYGINNS